MAGIPLSHAPDGVGYKLLELPAELVALIEEENGPTTLTLTTSPTTALLKTPKGIYSLRQKNTSNALILLRPGSSSSPAEDEETTTTTALQAFTTIHETIELIPLEVGQDIPVAKARGKWHEKFGRTR